MTCFILIIYTPKFQSSQAKNGDLYGTYQFNIRDLDHTQYLAAIPHFMTFYEDDHSIATIFFADGKYYFVDDSLEPQVITKISNEPMVAEP